MSLLRFTTTVNLSIVNIRLCNLCKEAIAASQIYSMLMDYKSPITVKIDGIAASAASDTG